MEILLWEHALENEFHPADGEARENAYMRSSIKAHLLHLITKTPHSFRHFMVLIVLCLQYYLLQGLHAARYLFIIHITAKHTFDYCRQL